MFRRAFALERTRLGGCSKSRISRRNHPMWSEEVEGIMAVLKAPYIGCNIFLFEKNEARIRCVISYTRISVANKTSQSQARTIFIFIFGTRFTCNRIT